jgi:hypothetical protein
VSRALSGSKTRGESADSPLTTMPETPTPALFLGLSIIKSHTTASCRVGPRRIKDLRETYDSGRQSRAGATARKRQYLSRPRRHGLTFPNVRGQPFPAWVPDRIRPALKGSVNMKLVRTAGLFLAVTAALVSGCGRTSRRPQHGVRSATAAPRAEPTPDTTPIEALRTPAGLVLKIDAQTPSGPLRGPTGEGGNVSPAPSPPKP